MPSTSHLDHVHYPRLLTKMEERQEQEEEVQKQEQSEEVVEPAEGGKSISKKLQKKLLKAQKIEETKDAKRKQEKEKRKANRLKLRLAGIDTGKEKRELNARPKTVMPAKVVIDLSFDELMTEREIISMGQQLGALYSLNKLSCNPFSGIIFIGPSEQSLLETSIGLLMESKNRGHWNLWKSIVVRPVGGLEAIDLEQGGQEAVCKKDQLIYLSADSDTVLESIEEDKMYIIGGLVDRNRHKCLCAKKAERLGIQTRKLPIEPSRLVSSTVLTVSGVVGILLAFNETKNWDVALNRCLPKRKVKDKVKSAEKETKEDEVAL